MLVERAVSGLLNMIRPVGGRGEQSVATRKRNFISDLAACLLIWRI